MRRGRQPRCGVGLNEEDDVDVVHDSPLCDVPAAVSTTRVSAAGGGEGRESKGGKVGSSLSSSMMSLGVGACPRMVINSQAFWLYPRGNISFSLKPQPTNCAPVRIDCAPGCYQRPCCQLSKIK